MTTDSSFLFPLQLRSDFCLGAAECCCAQPGSMARARLVNGMSLTAVSPLPAFKTQYLTGAIPQGRKSRAGRKHILLKINGGDVFITLQLNCTNLCTAVCESRLGGLPGRFSLGRSFLCSQAGVCVESQAVWSYTHQASGKEKSNFS